MNDTHSAVGTLRVLKLFGSETFHEVLHSRTSGNALDVANISAIGGGRLQAFNEGALA